MNYEFPNKKQIYDELKNNIGTENIKYKNFLITEGYMYSSEADDLLGGYTLTEKGNTFLENYENRNIIDKFEDLMNKYPNFIKIPVSFILGIIVKIIYNIF